MTIAPTVLCFDYTVHLPKPFPITSLAPGYLQDKCYIEVILRICLVNYFEMIM